MKPKLQIQESTLHFEVNFAHESARLLEGGHGVVSKLLDSLREFGASLQGFQIEPSFHDLSRSSITFHLLGGHGTVTVMAGRAVLQLMGGPDPVRPDVPRMLPLDELVRIVEKLVASLQEVDSELEVGLYSVQYACHCTLEGVTPAELVRQYVTASPPQLGEPDQLSVRFTYAPREGERGSSVLLEPSLSYIPNGLFATLRIAFDHGDAQISGAPALLRARLDDLLSNEHLPVEIA